MPARRDHGLLEGDRTAGECGPATAASGYFPPRAAERTLTLYMGTTARFASRSKIAGLRHPSLALRPSATAPGAGPIRPPSE